MVPNDATPDPEDRPLHPDTPPAPEWCWVVEEHDGGGDIRNVVYRGEITTIDDDRLETFLVAIESTAVIRPGDGVTTTKPHVVLHLDDGHDIPTNRARLWFDPDQATELADALHSRAWILEPPVSGEVPKLQDPLFAPPDVEDHVPDWATYIEPWRSDVTAWMRHYELEVDDEMDPTLVVTQSFDGGVVRELGFSVEIDVDAIDAEDAEGLVRDARRLAAALSRIADELDGAAR